MPHLKLNRLIFTESSTIGDLYLDNVFQCRTLEDVVRPVGESKVPGKTAIPSGTYKVEITFSNRFQRDLPLLVDVPNFSGIRIHPGNTPENTDGCILVGRSIPKGSHDFIAESRLAFEQLYPKLWAAQNAGEAITIEIN